MSSINTNVAAMTALQTLTQTNKQLTADSEPDLDRLPRCGRIRQRGLLVDRDHDAVRQFGALHRAGRARPRRRDGRHRLYGREQRASRSSTRSRASSLLHASPASTATRYKAKSRSCSRSCSGIADSASFSGENWLSVDSSDPGYNAVKTIVSSFSRSGGAVTIGTIIIDLGNTKLFDATDQSGILDTQIRPPTAA